ncbi:MAG: hypothetical protein WB992_14480 [Bryobacteraceae bacterium]
MSVRFVLCALILSCAPFAQATSIVILRSPSRVYIGADSRRTYRDSNNASYAGSICKIVPAGPLFFVASGLTYANNRQVADIGADAGRTGRSVLYAMEAFRGRMQVFLPSALAAQREVEQSYVGDRQGLVLESAFIGFENGLATVTVEWYSKNGTASNPRVTTDRRTYSSAIPGRYDFIFLGKRRAIDQYLARRTPSVRNDASAVAWITRLIGLEASESPESTALPIDILELDTFGPRWLEHRAACDASL